MWRCGVNAWRLASGSPTLGLVGATRVWGAVQVPSTDDVAGLRPCDMLPLQLPDDLFCTKTNDLNPGSSEVHNSLIASVNTPMSTGGHT